MRILRVLFFFLVISGLISSVVLAMKHLPEERGKILFNDPKFAGGTKSCNACHPDGNGVEKAADKKEFNIMGKTQKSLEEAVNVCIVNANKGRAIDIKSGQMKDIVAYIRSLKGKTGTPKK